MTKLKTFFEKSFSEPIQNHVKSFFTSYEPSKKETIEKLHQFKEPLRIKNEYSALFFWYIVREYAIEKKLNYSIICQKFYESLIEKENEIMETIVDIEENNNEEEEEEEEGDENDQSDEENNKIDNNSYENKIKKSIKLLIKVYKSSIINNTFIQKDIKSIQNYYLKNYQINSIDSSIRQSQKNNSYSNNNNINNNQNNKAPTQLIKVYSQYKKESLLIKHNLADKQLFTREKLTKFELSQPMIDYGLYKNSKTLEKELGINKIGDWSINPSLELFQECFKVYTNNILDGIQWGNGNDENEDDRCKVIVSGGSVTSCLSSLPKSIIKEYLELQIIYRLLSNHSGLPFTASKMIFDYVKPYHKFYDKLFEHYHSGNSPYMKGDIDLFFITPTIEEGKKKLEQVALKLRENMIQKKGLDFKFVRTQNSITIVSEYPYRSIQLMIFFIRSIEDLILFFDLDCVCTAYNGDNVYVLPRTINSFNKRLNMIPPSIFKEDNDRLYKYCLRGFNSICFENCLHKPRCDRKEELYESILEYIPMDQYERPHFIVSSFNEASSIFHFPYGPETKFNEVLESIDIYSYRNSYQFKSQLLEVDARKDVILVLPCEWRFKHIKVHALSSNLKFKCYVCKEPLEDTTNRICPQCQDLSRYKINQFYKNIDSSKELIQHKVAIVTGGRIKIGFEITKILLQFKFKVVITTRFPASAYEEYKKILTPSELSNLFIYGVDFRNLQSVQQFIDTIKSKFSKIDILINNASQTIRYPRAYYNNLLNNEKNIISTFIDNKQPNNIISKLTIQSPILNQKIESNLNNNNNNINNNNELLIFNNNNYNNNSTHIIESIILDEDKEKINESLFPTGKLDLHGQQLDLRTKHSWTYNIEDISTAEMLEVQLINNTVPFMLINQLSSMMGSNKNDEYIIKNYVEQGNKKSLNDYLAAKEFLVRPDWSCIINVTSPEGNINHEPNAMSGYHVHTNIAKAGLNMMTKTIAYQFEKQNIYVAASDTGWISDMQPYSPYGIPSRPPPLTEFDGAARVLYPVFHHLFYNDRLPSGVQFINFNPTNW